MMHRMLSRLLYEEVFFETKLGFQGKGEVRILGSGKVGISTPTSVFPYQDIQKVRRVK
jgi:hypothetical protein